MAAWALVLGLAVTACSTGEPAPGSRPSSPTPLPPPARALVAWSTAACGTVESLDDLRKQDDDYTGSSATSYLMSVSTAVQGEAQKLRTIQPSGVKAADAYVAGLVKTLTDLQARLPNAAETMTSPDKEKVAKAKLAAQTIATLKPQGPVLAGVVQREPRLVASYNVTPDCEPVRSSGRPAGTAPTRALVVWSETMCTYAGLAQKSPAGGDEERGGPEPPGFDQFRALELMSFIRDSESRLTNAADKIEALSPTGVADADRYRSRLLSSIRTAARKLPGYDKSELGRLSLGRLESEAEKVADTLATVEPKGDDLPAMVGRHPSLTAANDLAPACEPLRQGGPGASPSTGP